MMRRNTQERDFIGSQPIECNDVGGVRAEGIVLMEDMTVLVVSKPSSDVFRKTS